MFDNFLKSIKVTNCNGTFTVTVENTVTVHKLQIRFEAIHSVIVLAHLFSRLLHDDDAVLAEGDAGDVLPGAEGDLCADSSLLQPAIVGVEELSVHVIQ